MPGQQENEGTAGQNSPWFAFYLVISKFSLDRFVLLRIVATRDDEDGVMRIKVW